MNKLIEPPLNGSFIANGTKYNISSDLSTERYEILERYGIQFGFGSDFVAFFNGLGEAINLLDQDKKVSAGIELANMRKGLANIEQGFVYAFEVCTLFINAEDEDIRFWSKEMQDKKREDWRVGGISSKFFFQQAALSVPGFILAYKSFALDTLTQE